VARPSVDGLERALHGRLTVVRVDIEAPAAALVRSRYGLRATPTYVLVDGRGNEVWRPRRRRAAPRRAGPLSGGRA
jgi:hypothetical protein